MQTYNHTIDGKVVATYRNYPKFTLKQRIQSKERARQTAKLLKMFSK